MSQPKVSVIMPVYNTEAYLEEAINSVLVQTLEEWELIVVNDGSTDGSLAIMINFIEKDSRIRLINQSNQGQSAARNSALKVAVGKYVYFLDSDDEITPETLAICYKHCEKYSLDFVFFDADTKYESGIDSSFHNVSYVRQKMNPFEVLNGAQMMKNLIVFDEFIVQPCMVFTRRSYIEERDFSFYEGIVHEDQLYISKLFLCALRVMYVPERLFVRRFRANSTMTATVKWNNIRSYFIVAHSLKEFAKNNIEFVNVVDMHLRITLNAVLWEAHIMSLNDRIRIFKITLKEWSSYITIRTWAVLLFKKYLPK